MLEIAAKLPSGALIGSEDHALSQAIQQSGGARFIARDADLIQSGGQITGWREAMGAVIAGAAEPNTGNSRFGAGPPGALLRQAGVNCGFVLSAFAPKVDCFTAVVIMTSQGEARTLVSVSTGRSNNQIFVSESEGRLLAKDRAGTAEVTLPSPSVAKAQMVVFGFDGRALWLSCAGRTISVKGSLPGLDHPADFFIGCRSNRAGIAKTLGASLMHEVMFWPDRALLGSDKPEDMATLAALDRYFRWVW